jgi:hypothetical protein
VRHERTDAEKGAADTRNDCLMCRMGNRPGPDGLHILSPGAAPLPCENVGRDSVTTDELHHK